MKLFKSIELAVVGAMVCVLTIGLISWAETSIYPGFVLFGLLAFVPPGILITRQLAAAAPLDVLSPFFLVPVTVGIVYIRAPELLRIEGQIDGAGTVAQALLLGIVAYYAGVLFWRSVSPTGSSLVTASPRPVYSPPRPVVIYGAFAIGAFSMVVFWARAGGIPVLMGDLENARIAALTGSGVPFYLSMLMMVACWLALDPRAGISRPRMALMYIAAAVLLSTTGWRNTVFALLVVAILVRHYLKPFRSMLLLLAGALAVLGAVALGLYRVYSSGIEHYLTYQQVARGDIIGATGTYLLTYADAFARNLATVFKVVPEALAFQGGTTFVWNFLALAPDSDLEPFDFVLKQAAGEGFQGGGLPPTMVGEWYLNFSWLGVVLGMALIGAIAEMAHRRVLRASSTLERIAGVLVVYYLFVAVRGGIGNVLLTISWLLLALFLVARISSTKSAGPQGDHQRVVVRGRRNLRTRSINGARLRN